jgi:hypothetical protein
MGYGKHEYHNIDPSTINCADFAKVLNDEEVFFGDVRQYNTAYNEKNKNNTVDLDWLNRRDTIFSTNAEGLEGRYRVVESLLSREGTIECRCVKVDCSDSEQEVLSLNCVALGCVADSYNLYKDVETSLIEKGIVGGNI